MSDSTIDPIPHSALSTQHSYHWWQTGVIYQIYPRSYQDTNADGIGDLPGVTSRLDYLLWLGIEAVWISPIYPSPMADFGYDVAGYTDIDPQFGTLADFDKLVRETHTRSLKVILDFVPNHTSDQHPWFLESRASRNNPKRDWYIWADPAPGGGPPNNWLSVFGGGTWQWDAATGQYYMHSFIKEQPDLNWRNPDVQKAMLNAMRFWLERGVDGFRVDVIDRMIKDEQLRDDPPNPEWTPDEDPYKSLLHIYSDNRPEVHAIIRMMRDVLNEYDERMMVGETYLPLPEAMKFYGKDGDEAHLPFNFELIRAPWDASFIQDYIEKYEAALPDGGWPNWVLGNHDRHRVASRLGLGQARVAQMLLLTLRGTPTCYYGDEIGMTDVAIPPDKIQDPWGLNVPGLNLGRDPERTPMQWDISPNAGFTAPTVEPWLPIGEHYKSLNVAVEQTDPTSMLSLFHALTALRRDTSALTIGSYTSVTVAQENVLAYVREHDGDKVLVALNFTGESCTIDLSGYGERGAALLSTYCDRVGEEELQGLALRGNEGIIVRL